MHCATPEVEAPQNRRVWLVILAALFLFITIRTAWVSDDAYITLRTVRNLLSGFGPVWNIGERVQAYTHPLWMMVLAGVIALTREYYFSTIVLSVGFALLAFLLVGRALARSTSALLIASLLLIFSKTFIDYASSGLENPLSYLLIALFAWLLLKDDLTRRQLALAAFVACLLVLNRMDTALLVFPGLAFLYWQAYRRFGVAVLAILAAAFLPFLLWEGFSLLYYGFPFPNTAYAKLDSDLPLGVLIQSGVFYFLESVSVDPLTGMTILIAAILAWLQGDWRLRWLSVGMLLYLFYVLRLGGDFMAGRFLSTPFLVAVVILASLIRLPLSSVATLLMTAAVVLVGFFNPLQTPVLSNATYAMRVVDSNGIADERGVYYGVYGLLRSNRNNRLVQTNAQPGTENPANFVHCGIGMRGFSASPYTHIVDACGLADALLARLPPMHDPEWRIGHPLRAVPGGYMRSIQSGSNQLNDPRLAQYYDKLNLILRAPLFDRQRLWEIWRFNRGAYDFLIDQDHYRYPTAVTVSSTSLVRRFAADAAQNPPRLFGKHGLRIDLGAVQHATQLVFGTELEHFTILYYHSGRRVAQQTVVETPLTLADHSYVVVAPPREATSAGFDLVHLVPEAPTSDPAYALTAMEAHTWTDSAAPDRWPPQVVAELYYAAFYRSTGAERTRLLDSLQARLLKLTDEDWRGLGLDVITALLEMPNPTLHDLILRHLPDHRVLVDESGSPLLRYIGSTMQSDTSETAKTGLHVRLYFETLATPTRNYTLWFNMTRSADDRQWMIYDYPLAQQTTEWTESQVYTIEAFLELDPGVYTVSAGFWTPIYRDRLTIENSEAYWLDLGPQQVTAHNAD